jgi:DNA-binding MarR family transcriptional regulator
MSSERWKLIGEITDRIGRTTRSAMQMNHAAAGVLGINDTDMRCLQLLQDGPLTAGELARRTGLTTASMTAAIDRLEAAGFVARVRDPADRRRVVVELQRERARTDIAPVFLPVLRSWRAALSGYTERDLRLIATFLDQVEQALDTEVRRHQES